MIGVYVPGNSLLHRLPAGFKIIALMVSIIAVAVLVRSPMAAGIALAATAATFVVAWIPPRHAWAQVRGVMWLLLALFAFQWVITDLARAFVVTAILLSSVGLAAVVTLTTRTADMLDAMIRALRPLDRFGVRTDLVAMTFALTIRSIPLIADVLTQVDQARRARGLRAGPRVLLAPTVLAALQTADGFAETLAARGMD